jgi:hypothetical protein
MTSEGRENLLISDPDCSRTPVDNLSESPRQATAHGRAVDSRRDGAGTKGKDQSGKRAVCGSVGSMQITLGMLDFGGRAA